jgi:transcriptional regulator of acetoin/glycerol metabolism
MTFDNQTDDISGQTTNDSQKPTFSLIFTPDNIPTLANVARDYLRQLSDMQKKNQLTAAEAIKLSGLGKDTYYRRLEKHGLKTKK